MDGNLAEDFALGVDCDLTGHFRLRVLEAYVVAILGAVGFLQV